MLAAADQPPAEGPGEVTEPGDCGFTEAVGGTARESAQGAGERQVHGSGGGTAAERFRGTGDGRGGHLP